MSNKMKAKIIFLTIFAFMDIGFIPRFSEYNSANKIVIVFFYVITGWIMWSIIHEIKIDKLKKEKFEETIQNTIRSIRSGVIPRIENCSLILKNDEFACNEVQTYIIETKNKAIGSTGSGSGVSIRVFRGVSVHSGTNRSRKIYRDVTEKYFGNFIITNQRIVFLNNQKGFEIPYKNLTGLFSSGKNLILQSKNKSYTIFVNTPTVFEELIRTVAKL